MFLTRVFPFDVGQVGRAGVADRQALLGHTLITIHVHEVSRHRDLRGHSKDIMQGSQPPPVKMLMSIREQVWVMTGKLNSEKRTHSCYINASERSVTGTGTFCISWLRVFNQYNSCLVT